jgi:hypothetical protein
LPAGFYRQHRHKEPNISWAAAEVKTKSQISKLNWTAVEVKTMSQISKLSRTAVEVKT